MTTTKRVSHLVDAERMMETINNKNTNEFERFYWNNNTE